MSQLFTYVNTEKQERISSPGSATPYGRLTNPVATALVTYVLFEGPMDGTAFKRLADTDTERYRNARDEFIEQEKELEQELFEERMDERPEFVTNRFEREHDVAPEEAPTTFEEWVKQDSWSVYRDEDGNWDYTKMEPPVIANFLIDELEFAGRWAGDPVRIIGEYDESKLYDEARGDDWTNITDGVVEEFTELVGEDWIEEAEEIARINPDMVFKA